MEVCFEADSSPEPNAVLTEPAASLAQHSALTVMEANHGAESSPDADMGLTDGDAACMAQSSLSPADSAAAWHATAEWEQRRADGSWQPSDSPVSGTEHTPQHAENSIQPAEALPVDASLS